MDLRINDVAAAELVAWCEAMHREGDPHDYVADLLADRMALLEDRAVLLAEVVRLRAQLDRFKEVSGGPASGH